MLPRLLRTPVEDKARQVMGILGLYKGFIGILEKKMETTIQG